MKFNITFRNMDASTAVKDYVRQKVTRVKKFVPEPVEASVVLSTQRHNHVCDISIYSQGKFYQGTESSEDMYSSIDRVMDKIQRQLRDSKGRNSRH
jgi:putative sigma-54 modulation protein